MEENKEIKEEVVEEAKEKEEKFSIKNSIDYIIIIVLVLTLLIIALSMDLDKSIVSLLYTLGSGILLASQVRYYMKSKSLIYLISSVLWLILCVLQFISFMLKITAPANSAVNPAIYMIY